MESESQLQTFNVTVEEMLFNQEYFDLHIMS